MRPREAGRLGAPREPAGHRRSAEFTLGWVGALLDEPHGPAPTSSNILSGAGGGAASQETCLVGRQEVRPTEPCPAERHGLTPAGPMTRHSRNSQRCSLWLPAAAAPPLEALPLRVEEQRSLTEAAEGAGQSGAWPQR